MGCPGEADPHEILRPLRRVRQVREFTAEVPSDAALDAIADVGRWTGSAGTSQPWRFLVLRDAAHAAPDLWSRRPPQTRALATATAAIAIVLPVGEHDIADAYDDGRAAERLLIAASYLGLGAAIQWVRTDVRDAVNEAARAPGRPPCPDDHRARLSDRGRVAAQGRARRGPPPRDESVFRDRWPG